MNIVNSSLHSLEWPDFLAYYSTFCYSSPAQERALSLELPNDKNTSAWLLELTKESSFISPIKSFSSLSGLSNLDKAFQRLAKAACLSGQELYGFANLVSLSEDVLVFMKSKGNKDSFPNWYAVSESIHDLPNLREIVFKCIQPDGNVKDQASPKLAKLRTEEKRIHQDARKEVERVLKKSYHDGLAQDLFYDVRDGRYVIPIKRDARSQVPGITYESSSSKATVYIEPESLRGTNDRIRQIQIDIEEEIYEILLSLTKQLAPHVNELWTNYEKLIDLDLSLGRARLAQDLEEYKHASAPQIKDFWKLESFYHPLLRKILPASQLITSNCILEPEHKCIIISGPNTGGKTVLLKSLGMAALLLQGGFFLPAYSGATMPYFRKILAHIGDEQSIEKSLSSFSSSILLIKKILEEAGEDTLVLIDEILSSTDPKEASALSKAILRELAKKKATTIVTTHFSDLKELSGEGPHFLNASMEFDTKAMQPLYKLKLGIPGRSWAIETASRLGLEKNIIEEAFQNLGKSHIAVDSLIAKIEEKSGAIDQEKERLQQEKESLYREMEAANILRKQIEAEKLLWKEKLTAEYDLLKKKSMAAVEVLISEYKEKISHLPKFHEEVREVKRKIVEVKKNLEENISTLLVKSDQKFEKEDSPEEVIVLQSGSLVKLKNLKMTGILLTDPKEKNKSPEVLVGSMKIKSSWQHIIAIQKNGIQKEISSSKSSVAFVRSIDCPAELNLLGLRADDALQRLTEYLDQAAQSNLFTARIIHGHGSGALKKIVRDYLKTNPYGLVFRAGNQEEGGDGCTVIELSK